jgi:hypothetical protein
MRRPDLQTLHTYFIATILMIAATFKILSGDGVWPSGNDEAGWWAIASAELALAGWLFSGWRPMLAQGAAAGAFGVFFVVSLTKALRGEVSCGCFGAWSVPPQATAVLNAMVLLGFAIVSPPIISGGMVGRVGGMVGVLAMLAGAGWFVSRPSVASSVGLAEVVHPREFLTRERRIEELVPLPLYEGHWCLAFYVPGCNKCEAVLADLKTRISSSGRNTRLVFVELAGANTANPPHIPEKDGGMRVFLPKPITFATPVPVFVVVRDGTVFGYFHSSSALASSL